MTTVSSSTPMSGRRTALVGGLMVAAGPLSISLYGPALPTIVADLSTTAAMGKMSLSVYFGAFALAQLVCGPLSDSWGRRRVTMWFMGLYMAGSLVASFGPDIFWLLAGRVLQGIGVSVGVALSRAMVRDQFSGGEAIRILTLINLILTVAPAIAPTLGSALLVVGSWHVLFVVMALYGLAIIGLMGLAARETHPPERRVRFSPRAVLGHYRTLLSAPSFLLPAGMLGLAFGGFYGFAALLPFVLIDELGLGTFEFAMVMLIQTGAFILGNIVAGRLSHGLNGRRLVGVGLVMIALAGLGFALGPRLFPLSVLAVMGPVALWMLALAFIGPSVTEAAMARFGAIAGAAGAMTGMIQIGGGFVGSLLASLLFEDAGSALTILMPIMAALTVAVALMAHISE